MTSEGTPWPHTTKKPPKNWVIHDSSEKTCFSSNLESEPSSLFQIQLDGLQIPVS